MKKILREKGKLWQMLLQFIKFGIVGISNTMISWVTYALCIRVGGHWFFASVIAFFVSVLNAFYWNNKYVFKQGDGERVWWKALARTYMAYGATGLILNNILLFLWLEILHIEMFLEPAWHWFYNAGIHFESSQSLAEYLAPVFNYVITIPLNFILNKFWAYGDKSGLKEKINED